MFEETGFERMMTEARIRLSKHLIGAMNASMDSGDFFRVSDHIRLAFEAADFADMECGCGTLLSRLDYEMNQGMCPECMADAAAKYDADEERGY